MHFISLLLFLLIKSASYNSLILVPRATWLLSHLYDVFFELIDTYLFGCNSVPQFVQTNYINAKISHNVLTLLNQLIVDIIVKIPNFSQKIPSDTHYPVS